jgi:DHA2 family multidrug resistance protein
MSMFFLPLITLSLSGVAPERIASASGLFNFARILAGSFGTSIATTFWDRRATLHQTQLVERITAFQPQVQEALAGLQANGMSAEQAHGVLNRMVEQQAFMLSANDVFYASALLFLALVGVVWLAKPPARGEANVSAAGAGAH